MMWWLMINAFAGGGGLYGQLGTGAAWSNTTGPLVRGNGTHVEIGAYGGPYRGSMRYGRYRRFGLRGSLQSHQPFRNSNEGTVGASLGVTVAQGFDLMNVGYWMGVTVGPAARLQVDGNTPVDDWPVKIGGSVRGEIGGLYNIAPVWGLGIRLEAGLDVIPGIGQAVAGGFGVTSLFRVPLRTPKGQARRKARAAR